MTTQTTLDLNVPAIAIQSINDLNKELETIISSEKLDYNAMKNIVLKLKKEYDIIVCSSNLKKIEMYNKCLEYLTSDRANIEPVAVELVAVEPVAVEPVAVEPVAVEPVAVELVAVEPVVYDYAMINQLIAEDQNSEIKKYCIKVLGIEPTFKVADYRSKLLEIVNSQPSAIANNKTDNKKVDKKVNTAIASANNDTLDPKVLKLIQEQLVIAEYGKIQPLAIDLGCKLQQGSLKEYKAYLKAILSAHNVSTDPIADMLAEKATKATANKKKDPAIASNNTNDTEKKVKIRKFDKYADIEPSKTVKAVTEGTQMYHIVSLLHKGSTLDEFESLGMNIGTGREGSRSFFGNYLKDTKGYGIRKNVDPSDPTNINKFTFHLVLPEGMTDPIYVSADSVRMIGKGKKKSQPTDQATASTAANKATVTTKANDKLKEDSDRTKALEDKNKALEDQLNELKAMMSQLLNNQSDKK